MGARGGGGCRTAHSPYSATPPCSQLQAVGAEQAVVEVQAAAAPLAEGLAALQQRAEAAAVALMDVLQATQSEATRLPFPQKLRLNAACSIHNTRQVCFEPSNAR